MFSHALSWRSAWATAAYGDDGFWRTERPIGHFRTAAATTDLQARMIAAVLARAPEIGAVVDLGAGDGQLLNSLLQLRPDLAFYGIDLRERPDDLDDDVTWCRDLWDVETTAWTSGEAFVVLATLDRPTLLLAVEWLDDLPCTICQRQGRSLRLVDVDDTGNETLGMEASADDHAWAGHWWPEGPRVEVGSSRDRAWAAACAQLQGYGGLGLVIDYGHLGADRPSSGTLTGFSHGHQCPPLPTGQMNLTAHVAIDAVAVAAEHIGAETVELVRQKDVAERLLAQQGPVGGDALTALVRRSEMHAITAPTVFGDFWWLLQRVPPADRR
ncbi:SAM-dependent methyltransferase [Microlunatus panaciterrae]|uniref:SAM-dependent MidA family methyltransferase n=1 Tax=Microlunatus panaciterrae TaxID=400768 RepID=A0ABS2RHD4_9ACTN|nr:SAM-dependent methyltransferase [Microlunatus panaciterrae]MBM7798419.1 SAM-dependent MidA family methyltransferase [Microlunatus panaciterrae]